MLRSFRVGQPQVDQGRGRASAHAGLRQDASGCAGGRDLRCQRGRQVQPVSTPCSGCRPRCGSRSAPGSLAAACHAGRSGWTRPRPGSRRCSPSNCWSTRSATCTASSSTTTRYGTSGSTPTRATASGSSSSGCGQQWTFGSTVARAKVDVVSELTRPNSLFLSVAARTDVAGRPAPVPMVRSESLVFRSPGTPAVENEVVDFIARSDQHRRRLTSQVRAADLGIQDMAVPPVHGLIDELNRERADIEGELRSVDTAFRDARERYERAFAGGSTADDATRESLATWDAQARTGSSERFAYLDWRAFVRLERDASTLQFAHGDKAIVLAEERPVVWNAGLVAAARPGAHRAGCRVGPRASTRSTRASIRA